MKTEILDKESMIRNLDEILKIEKDTSDLLGIAYGVPWNEDNFFSVEFLTTITQIFFFLYFSYISLNTIFDELTDAANTIAFIHLCTLTLVRSWCIHTNSIPVTFEFI